MLSWGNIEKTTNLKFIAILGLSLFVMSCDRISTVQYQVNSNIEIISKDSKRIKVFLVEFSKKHQFFDATNFFNNPNLIFFCRGIKRNNFFISARKYNGSIIVDVHENVGPGISKGSFFTKTKNSLFEGLKQILPHEKVKINKEFIINPIEEEYYDIYEEVDAAVKRKWGKQSFMCLPRNSF